ncbi:MAG: hypothetical protein WDN23_16190 [Edaphobacter sp.]
MQYQLCRHIKANGTRCKSPSLTEGKWCYFHDRLHDRHKTYRHTEATRGYLVPGQHIELTALEDRESVQLALSCVINALATGRLEIKRATVLLYGLQLASNNAARLRTEPANTIRTIDPSPEGLDLAEPATLEEEPELNLTWDPVDEDEDDDEDEEDEELAEWNKVLAGEDS